MFVNGHPMTWRRKESATQLRNEVRLRERPLGQEPDLDRSAKNKRGEHLCRRLSAADAVHGATK
jgi:hypothetical protein